jgi:GDP-L-fucose synthase
MKKNDLIYVAAHEDLIGAAIIRKLKEKGYKNLILKKDAELDLTRQKETENFFGKIRPKYVFLPSVKTGGIFANKTYPADFIYQNLSSQTNVIQSAFKSGAKKLLFLGSACSYPKMCPQPIKESCLLDGQIEPTNEAYAVAKIAGIKMCQSYNKQYKTNFICAIPTNTYGPNDHFDQGGHVIPGLIRKFYQANAERYSKSLLEVWGTGKPQRDFLYVDDIADACIFLMNKYDGNSLINIGGGEAVSISGLVDALKKITGFSGKIVYQKNKPDGMPKRILDAKRILSLGWRPKIGLDKGLRLTYEWYKKNYGDK